MEKYKNVIKNKKFKISAPTWNVNPSIAIYINKIENRINLVTYNNNQKLCIF